MGLTKPSREVQPTTSSARLARTGAAPPLKWFIAPVMVFMRKLQRWHDASRLCLAGWAGVLLLAGCTVTPPEVPRDAALLTGVDNAIVFRSTAEDHAAPAPHELFASQAVRLALLHDPRIQSALAKVRIAEADANQSRLLANPILAITYRLPTVPDSNHSFEATLTGDLVQLLQMPAHISAADKRLRAAAADALTTTLDVMAEVQTVYDAVQSLDAQVTNAQRRLDIARQLGELAHKRLNAGDAVRLDVLTFDSQALQAELDLADLAVQRREQRLILAKLIGEGRSAADWQLEAWVAQPGADSAPETMWIDAALACRPEIKSRLWELSALGDDLTAAYFSPFTGGSLGVNAEHDPDWRVGPAVSTPVPVFDFGQAGRARVEAQKIAARHDLEQTRENLIQEVRVAYMTWQATGQSLAAMQTKLLPMLHEQRQQAETAYKAGDSDMATFLLAQTDYETGMAKVLLLQQRVNAARINLYRAVGGFGVAMRVESAAREAAIQPSATGPTP